MEDNIGRTDPHNTDTRALDSFLLRTRGPGCTQYKCSLCPYTTKRFTDLMSHHNKHTGDKPYHCKKCNFKSSWSSAFYLHECVDI